MPYPRRPLNRHEQVAVDLHPHWWYYATPVLVLVAAIVVGIVTLTATDVGTTSRTAMTFLSLAALVGSTAWLVVRYVRWATTHFVITTDRVIFRAGVLVKRGVEIPLERVTAVHFRQGPVGRLFGTGDLVIESGGGDAPHRFTDVRRPARVQKMIHAQMDELQTRRFALAGAMGPGDVASQLERLEGMLQRGTLTAEEFRAHKDKLLGR